MKDFKFIGKNVEKLGNSWNFYTYTFPVISLMDAVTYTVSKYVIITDSHSKGLQEFSTFATL